MSAPDPLEYVIASLAAPGVAIQSRDWIGALSSSKRLDWFVNALLAMTGGNE
jgi:hypothetical protein